MSGIQRAQTLPSLARRCQVVRALQVYDDRVEPGGLVPGVNFQRLAIFAERLLGPPGIEVGSTHVRAGVDVLGITLQRPLVPLYGLLVLVLVIKKVGKLQRRFGVFGILGRQVLKLFDNCGRVHRGMTFRKPL